MSNTDNSRHELSRRDFLKTMGVASMATAGLAACGSGDKGASADGSDIPTDKMTMRVNKKTGDKVSLLGYGMMRLPSQTGRSVREGDEVIDLSRG